MGRGNSDESRELLHKYNLCFDGLVEPSDWPAAHKTLFQDVQRLGAYKYSDYERTRKERSPHEPWGSDILKRADRVRSIARKCSKEAQNEAGWRLSLEAEIFARFTVEVACPICRARIWRSEIEVELDHTDGNVQSLEHRRRNRKGCQCPPTLRQEDSCDVGINDLFSDRAEELVYHDRDLTVDALPKDRPDRIYGLRETKVFRDALYSEPRLSNTEIVKHVITSSPFQNVGEPLLFPFLILEAKSEKGADSWSSIERQPSLPIRTLLKMQEDLRKQSASTGYSNSEPLVWFLSYKGEEWRIYGSSLQTINGKTHYRTIILWRGNLCSWDEATQLLLIIDHIFDWTRDKYRCNILSQLRSLGIAEFNEMDSDIASMRAPPIIVDDIDSRESIEDRVQTEGHHDLSSNTLSIRYASHMVSEFIGLIVTSDSLRTMLHTFGDYLQTGCIVRKVLRILWSGCIDFTGKQLADLEELWTGESPMTASRGIEQTTFHAEVNFRICFTSDWTQKRQLICLAVAEDAVGTLLRVSERQRPPKIVRSSFEWDCLLGLFKRLAAASISFNLLAAIARTSLLLAVCNTDQMLEARSVNPIRMPTRNGATASIKSLQFVMESAGDQTCALVWDVYNRHKIGRREPSEAYIRRSSRLEQQKSWSSPGQDPFRLHENLQTTEESHVVVVSNICRGSPSPQVCLFCKSAKAESLTAAAIIGIFETLLVSDGVVYETSKYPEHKSRSSVEWNFTDFRTTSKKQYRWRLERVIGHYSEEIGIPSIYTDRGGCRSTQIPNIMLPAPHSMHDRQSLFSSEELNHPTSIFLKNKNEAYAITLCIFTFSALATLCKGALEVCGHKNPGKALAWLVDEQPKAITSLLKEDEEEGGILHIVDVHYSALYCLARTLYLEPLHLHFLEIQSSTSRHIGGDSGSELERNIDHMIRAIMNEHDVAKVLIEEALCRYRGRLSDIYEAPKRKRLDETVTPRKRRQQKLDAVPEDLSIEKPELLLAEYAASKQPDLPRSNITKQRYGISDIRSGNSPSNPVVLEDAGVKQTLDSLAFGDESTTALAAKRSSGTEKSQRQCYLLP